MLQAQSFIIEKRNAMRFGRKKPEEESFANRPFAQLSVILKQQGLKPLQKKTLQEKKEQLLSDEELFSEAMREVREIKDFREIPVSRKVDHPVRRKESGEELKILEEITKGLRPIHLPDTQEFIQWKNAGCRESVVTMLHGGIFSVQDFLDLHGHTLAEAEEEVKKFLLKSVQKGYSCVKIIHGRGLRSQKGPVLKRALVHWLSGRFRKRILAYCTARQCDGGLGAVYVLLRK
jgi:DNA-nicking Smr family endonuclease